MTDTHIHIHLNGEGSPGATVNAPAVKKARSKIVKKVPSKPKRAVSAYHKTVGKEMKRLKKANFRGNVMKKAHSIAKKKHKVKKK
jgi:N-formylglutamate amidohydrolase